MSINGWFCVHIIFCYFISRVCAFSLYTLCKLCKLPSGTVCCTCWRVHPSSMYICTAYRTATILLCARMWTCRNDDHFQYILLASCVHLWCVCTCPNSNCNAGCNGTWTSNKGALHAIRSSCRWRGSVQWDFCATLDWSFYSSRQHSGIPVKYRTGNINARMQIIL